MSVKVSVIKYPVPAAFNVIPVIAPFVTVVSTVNPTPVPPFAATPVAPVNPPRPLAVIDPSDTTLPGVGSPDRFSFNVVVVARLVNIAFS